MKRNSIFKQPAFIKTISITFFAIVMSVIAFAQDKKVDVNISSDSGGGGNFWASPWVWVIGGAVFILLLVALLRGGSKSD